MIAAVIGAALIAGAPPTPPIAPTAFGLHVASIGTYTPDVRLSSVRLWDTGTRWDQVETAQGQYNWAVLDAAVVNAEAAGADDILYVFGLTPQWAATDPALPGLYGPGTTSLPRKIDYYVDYARKVAKRYQGRITSYQIWNEANTRSFYEGDWLALAKITKRTHDAIKAIDADATIVAASSTVIPGQSFQTESFFVRYAQSLHDLGDPVDAMAVHLYPVDTSLGPDARVRAIRAVQKALSRLGIDKPLWDTEVNYGDRRPGLPQVVPDSATAATYVARTYLDAVRLGVARTYWYGWDIGVLGIDLTTYAGKTPAGQAFLTVRRWLTDSRLAGCGEQSSMVQCHFLSASGKPFSVVWSATPEQLQVARDAEICRLDGECGKVGNTVEITDAPVMIRE